MKAVIYYRVSTRKQGASGLGLEAQQESVRMFMHGKDYEVVETFKEVESGKKSNRVQLRAALELCRREGAVLIIAKLDRLARNVAFVSGLMESKIKFICVDMPFADNLTLHIIAAFAEWEGRRISERTREALERAKARGVKLGNGNREEARQRAREWEGKIADARACGAETVGEIARMLGVHATKMQRIIDRLGDTAEPLH